jgi:hypothetical protein
VVGLCECRTFVFEGPVDLARTGAPAAFGCADGRPTSSLTESHLRLPATPLLLLSSIVLAYGEARKRTTGINRIPISHLMCRTQTCLLLEGYLGAR